MEAVLTKCGDVCREVMRITKSSTVSLDVTRLARFLARDASVIFIRYAIVASREPVVFQHDLTRLTLLVAGKGSALGRSLDVTSMQLFKLAARDTHVVVSEPHSGLVGDEAWVKVSFGIGVVMVINRDITINVLRSQKFALGRGTSGLFKIRIRRAHLLLVVVELVRVGRDVAWIDRHSRVGETDGKVLEHRLEYLVIDEHGKRRHYQANDHNDQLRHSAAGLNGEKANHGQLEQEQTSVDMADGTREALTARFNLAIVHIQELMEVDKVVSDEEEQGKWENQRCDARIEDTC